MTRLIDADAVLVWFAEYWSMQKKLGRPSKQQRGIYMAMRSMVNSRPTVDAVPVRHGKWVFNPSDAIEAMFAKPKCSECGFESADGGNYCPNCGAYMRGESDE